MTVGDFIIKMSLYILTLNEFQKDYFFVGLCELIKNVSLVTSEA